VTFYRFFEQISLATSVTAVAMSMMVVYLWGGQAWRALGKREKSSQDLFILGVSFGFLAGALDSVYWMIPWTLDYIHYPEVTPFWRAGVYFNVLFRQFGDILAAMLHIYSFALFARAAGIPSNAAPVMKKLLLWSLVIGCVFVYLLGLI